ncbi:hypothetical protein WICPIJ_003637 [Wickerhamomyces pijperi]|uniref:1,3-beta-glucanosyltransferase n=1 Tax=Wickerhamomyces pijperi TaxID=599730 RepID=A0A9P8TNP4_WICPI|nr:hypothetical protein WICPIJ_003637 [Wickerhamomyces pijperi]
MKLSTLLFSTLAAALIPLELKGKRFIRPSVDAQEDGEVFFIKGIDYQPGGSSAYDSSKGVDAFTDAEACWRDAYAFQQLGINTVRVYSLNPDLNHDECVTIFNNAGIYLLLDVNNGEYGANLNRADPQGTYNAYYMSHVFKFIDSFKNYPNVLGFFSGNEVINDDSNYAETVPKYIRAVQRDMKQYIAKNSNRTIPVGYSSADNTDLRRATLEYLQCNNNDDDSQSDFFGLNSYQWCSGISDWQSSGYDVLNSTLSNATIPLLFSEFGCNTKSPRTFDEISDGLFGGLAYTFSGGLVYEYSEEASNYGVVEINDDYSITYLTDFTNLQSQYKDASTPVLKSSQVTNDTKHTCDSSIITDIYSGFGADFDIPEQSNDTKWLIDNGASGAYIGSLIDDLSPRKSNYTVYDVSSNEVSSATVTFADVDKANTQTGVVSSTAAAATTTAAAVGTTATASTSAKTSSSKAAGVANVGISFTGALSLILALLI